MYRKVFMMCSLFAGLKIAAQHPSAKNPVAPRPVIVPLPVANTGDGNKIISLNGTWKTTTAPATNYWKDTTGLSLWKETNVPGRGFAQLCQLIKSSPRYSE